MAPFSWHRPLSTHIYRLEFIGYLDSRRYHEPKAGFTTPLLPEAISYLCSTYY